MLKLNGEWLESLGLGALPPGEMNRFLAYAYEKLEMRVGMRLVERMTSGQVDEFEQIISAEDEPGALSWLEANFPDYREVVHAEVAELERIIAASAPEILAASAGVEADDEDVKEGVA